MNNALINLNKKSVLTFERALDSHHRELAKSLEDYHYLIHSQPKETGEMVRNSPDFNELLEEIEQTNLLKKQVAYQKRLLKI